MRWNYVSILKIQWLIFPGYIWFLIHAGIQVNPCKWKRSLEVCSIHNISNAYLKQLDNDFSSIPWQFTCTIFIINVMSSTWCEGFDVCVEGGLLRQLYFELPALFRLDMLTASRHLKSPQSLSCTSTYPTIYHIKMMDCNFCKRMTRPLRMGCFSLGGRTKR